MAPQIAVLRPDVVPHHPEVAPLPDVRLVVSVVAVEQRSVLDEGELVKALVVSQGVPNTAYLSFASASMDAVVEKISVPLSAPVAPCLVVA